MDKGLEESRKHHKKREGGFQVRLQGFNPSSSSEDDTEPGEDEISDTVAAGLASAIARSVSLVLRHVYRGGMERHDEQDEHQAIESMEDTIETDKPSEIIPSPSEEESTEEAVNSDTIEQVLSQNEETQDSMGFFCGSRPRPGDGQRVT